MQIFCSKAYIPFYSFLILNLLFNQVTAQTNSPYSRYGIGDLKNQESIQSRGMGGVSIADDPFAQINYLNPASYPGIRLTTLQAGLDGERHNVITKDSANITGSINIAYLTLGMPVGRNGGLAFGLMPESRVGYRALSSEIFVDSNQLTRLFEGKGGMQKLFVGYGHAIKDFSVGVNINFLFGNYSTISSNQFLDDNSTYTSENANVNNVKGINYNLGMQYHHLFKTGVLAKKRINIGATFTPQSNLNVNYSNYQYAYINPSFSDTIAKSVDQSTTLLLPNKFAGGILLSSGDNWKVGLDAHSAAWSNFKYNNAVDSTADSWAIKLGGSYRKSSLDNARYTEKIDYRLGVFTGNDYLKIRGKNIAATGVTFGIGLPLKIRKTSYGSVNIALQTGARGTTENNLVKERFTNFSIGLSVSEKWFLKRRYD
jgi:hypothetical protein